MTAADTPTSMPDFFFLTLGASREERGMGVVGVLGPVAAGAGPSATGATTVAASATPEPLADTEATSTAPPSTAISSSAVWNRSSGSLAIMRRMMSSNARCSAVSNLGVGSSSMMCL